MKSFFVPVLIILIAAFAPALSIDAPGSVPNNTSWGFSVALDNTDSWDKTSVSVDGSKILDVYSNGTIINDPFNGKFVLKSFVYDSDPSSNAGLTLFVSHFGISEGAHTISADSGSSSDSVNVLSVAPAGGSDFESRVKELERVTGVHDSLLAGQKIDNEEFWKKANSNEEKISSLESKISNVSGKIDSVESSVAQASASSDSDLSAMGERVATLEAEVFPMEAPEEDADLISGFVSLIGGLAMPVGILIVLMLLVAAVLVGKEKLQKGGGVKLFSKRDSFGLPVSDDDLESAYGDESDDDSGGKWKSK